MPPREGAASEYPDGVSRPLRLTLQVGAVTVLALLVGLFAKGLIDNATTVSALVADGKRPAAPNFTLDRLDGGKYSLQSAKGRPVILNFWASWCGPCKDEAPILALLSHKYAGKVDVVGVNSQDVTSDARDFAQRYGLGFTLVHDPGSVYRHWGLTGLPETFLIDPQGRVVRHFPGEISAGELEQALRPYVGGSSS
jgi:cytochrome c biogenesis protein CcmG, thiol:disulfide interchange protein DsbE